MSLGCGPQLRMGSLALGRRLHVLRRGPAEAPVGRMPPPGATIGGGCGDLCRLAAAVAADGCWRMAAMVGTWMLRNTIIK